MMQIGHLGGALVLGALKRENHIDLNCRLFEKLAQKTHFDPVVAMKLRLFGSY